MLTLVGLLAVLSMAPGCCRFSCRFEAVTCTHVGCTHVGCVLCVFARRVRAGAVSVVCSCC